jgi:hypothetical protein
MLEGSAGAGKNVALFPHCFGTIPPQAVVESDDGDFSKVDVDIWLPRPAAHRELRL